MNVNSAIDSALGMLRNELKYRARVERDLRAAAAGARQRAAPRAGVLEPDPERRPGAGRGGLQAQPGDRAQLRRRCRRGGRDLRQRAGDRGRGPAAHLRVVLHHQAARDGDRPRAARSRWGSCGRWAGRSSSTAGPGEGATFRVRLPADESSAPARVATPAPVPRARLPAPPRAGGRRRGAAAQGLPAHARRRARADDGARRARRRCASSGATSAFDVVLCDLQMPEVSGMELYAAVRERFPALADRFVFVTGGAFSSDARKFLEDRWRWSSRSRFGWRTCSRSSIGPPAERARRPPRARTPRAAGELTGDAPAQAGGRRAGARRAGAS